jgi:quinohemoprotein ethanol dehydrogenase
VKGAGLYAANCSICHGKELLSTGGPGPDLRESNIAIHEDDLWNATQGALIQSGMPKFDNLTREQIHLLHAYIRAGARKALAAP